MPISPILLLSRLTTSKKLERPIGYVNGFIQGAVVAVERVVRQFYGLQYHPEMDEEHQWRGNWNVAKCVAAAIKSLLMLGHCFLDLEAKKIFNILMVRSNSKLRRNKKKVIDSNLNENDLDGDDTNTIKRGNAQTAGSSSCDSDVDLDGGAGTSAWKTRTDRGTD
ncbi:hypothetical protein Tco_0536984 [Tanacetum coccineum]